MYRINYDDFLLHDLQVPSEHGYYLLNPVLKEEVNKIAELDFDISSTHPNFDTLEHLVPNIVLKKNNKTIFKGRIIKEQQNMDKSKQVTCESILAFLFDSVVRPYTFQGKPDELLKFYVDNHNSQVDVDKQFKLGKTTGANLDNNEYINRSNEGYSNTYDEIQDKLLNIGGYFYVRYEDDGNYLDWVDDFTGDVGQITSLQTIEFGENLKDIKVENDASNTYSVVIPLGAEIENEDGTKSRLTIESVNNGLDYLVNETALNKYGWIVAPIGDTTWNDVTIASNLKTKGQNLLNQQGVMLKSTLELNAIDLNVVDGSIDSFEMYEYIKVQSTPHGISKTYLLTKKETPLTKPENMTITLGETKNTLTGLQIGESQAIKQGLSKVESDYKINEEKISSLENSINYFSVDLSQYSLTIPTDNNNIPLETKNYDIQYYGYFKGKQIIPSVSISGSNTGITTNKTNTYIRFGVSNSTSISNLSNEYTITFTYTEDGTTYTVNKKINIALALKGSDGTSVNILGSYNSIEELKVAHPTGNVGDAYIVQGNMYVWCVDDNDWQNVGNIQGPAGADGQEGKSAYQVWLDAGNTGTEEEYLASLKGEQGIQGATGKDGTSYYFYVRYSINSNGNPMTTTPSDASKYMGVASTTSSTAPTSYSAYTWSLIKGEQGVQGQTGADGKSSYLHIKYSDDGTTFTSNNGEDVGRYRGELVDNNPNDSTTFSDYTWYDMALIVEEELEEIRKEVVNNTSLIEQTDTQIRLDVASEYVSTGTFDEFRETTETQFTVQADGIEAKFSEMVLMVENVEGETQAQFRELASYIRGYQNEEGQPVLELGSVTSDIILKQTNDRIQFIQNGEEVAYVSNNTLYITDGHFLNSLRVGDFAFIPRANGSLDFKKVTY